MIYALSDLHLDGKQNKPMDVFSELWKDHKNKIEANWRRVVGDEDTVLIAGDVSWALHLCDAISDLKWIDSLPGKKIISRGNHDYWWSSLKKMNAIGLKTIRFLQNDSISVEGYEICGSRIWLDESSKEYGEEDKKITNRELIRLKMSLDSANKDRPIIAMLHYPPFDIYNKPNCYSKLLEEYQVEACIYGHLHSVKMGFVVEGLVGGVEYFLTACDYINFTPILIRR